MIVDEGALVDLDHAERLTLAAAFTVSSDDASPAVGALFQAWAYLLGRATPLLDIAPADVLTPAALGELLGVLTSRLFAYRVTRLHAHVGRRHGGRPDTRRIAHAVGELAGSRPAAVLVLFSRRQAGTPCRVPRAARPRPLG